MGIEDLTVTALWWAVILSGFYHGVNPGMGWPLAVSSALMEGRGKALPKALVALAAGHFFAMMAILLPFSIVAFLVDFEAHIRVGAGLIVVAMGIYLMINRRHPRFLARVPPTKLALWSFLAALAHGAGLMLVPIYLGLCGVEDTGHAAAQALMGNSVITALSVAIVHTLAMTLAGGMLAVAIYIKFGLQAVRKTWFNLDVAWAASLVIVGTFGLAHPLMTLTQS
ncbi:hypothetical protein [Primorskyibacter sp. S187A]|uniref:hypothetical protein n=1 Tax=Primorskyibacter sp. S187A TaxID=3415130 RepID=UPI003C7E8B61